MEKIEDIAYWFLSRSSMTHKKLQKLCYYAQAWFCTLYDGEPLFKDEIQAWVHGPVIPALYRIYSYYKWNTIEKYEGCTKAFDEKVLDVLEAVYETYGGFSGSQLESLTHSEEPWINARGKLKPWETGNTVIFCADLREYYSKEYARIPNV